FAYKLPSAPPGTASGPLVSIFNFNGALNYIKIGFVYTRYNNFIDQFPNAASTLTASSTRSLYQYAGGYTNTNTANLQYTSSHVFTSVGTFGSAQTLVRRKALGEWNRFYFTLPDARYAIYGLSSFDLPKSSTNLCSGNINIDAKLNSINSYTVTTTNASPQNFIFSADIFTVNHFMLCKPAVGDQFVFKN
ncbi:MAG: hypothetical protein ACKO96_02285, partial [Flammeovirgaceae bacterium]